MWVPECMDIFPRTISNVHGVVGSLLLQSVFKYNLSVTVLGVSCGYRCSRSILKLLPLGHERPQGIFLFHVGFGSSLGVPDFSLLLFFASGFPSGSVSRESTCSVRDQVSISGSGRSPGEGNGYPLQYSCLENPMDGIA